MSDDDREERARVYSKIAPMIMEFHSLHTGELFHVEDLRQFVEERVTDIAPDSPGRILRALRLEGSLNYVIINRRDSLYQFRPIEPEPSPTEPVVVCGFCAKPGGALQRTLIGTPGKDVEEVWLHPECQQGYLR